MTTSTSNEQQLIPARSGVAVPLSTNQTIKVINTHGTQVIDFFCFDLPDINHYLSLQHTRASTCRISPLPGDVLTTNHRAPILEVLEDTTPGVHDTLIAACDLHRYLELEAARRKCSISELRDQGYYHESCADNCRKALGEFLNQRSNGGGAGKADLSEPNWYPPAPLNLFMNIPVHRKESGHRISDEVSPSAGATLSFDRPVTKPGQWIRMKALRDCVVVMSACPQDLLEINCGKPVECHFVVEG